MSTPSSFYHSAVLAKPSTPTTRPLLASQRDMVVASLLARPANGVATPSGELNSWRR